MKGRVSEMERQQERSSTCSFTPQTVTTEERTALPRRPKQGVGAQALGAPSARFPGALAGKWIESGTDQT